MRKTTIASTIATLLAINSSVIAAVSQDKTLEVIEVTATKRTERMQDVPVAMAALTADGMVERGITETSDLNGAVPNLIISSPFGRTQPNFSIRGISVANEYTANAASPIGVYVNEDYKQFRPSHGIQLFDLERLEIIRGPQGTLFGRNTTGGAVSVTTRKPNISEVGALSGFLNVKFGNYNSQSYNGAVETTVIDDVFAFRVAATLNKADGYVKNRTPDSVPTLLSQAGVADAVLSSFGLPTTNPVNALTDKDFSSTDDHALRLTALWTPTIDTEVIGVASFGSADPYGPVPIINPTRNGGLTDAFGYTRGDLGEDEVASDSAGKFKTEVDDYTLTIKQTINSDLLLTSITGYQEGSYITRTDCDGLAINSCEQRFNSDFDQFNQDLRLTWNGQQSRLIVGAYYGEDSIENHDYRSFFSPLADFGGLPTAAFGAIANDESGAFPATLQAQAAGIFGVLSAVGAESYPVFNPPVSGWFALDNFVGLASVPLATATGFQVGNSFTQKRTSAAIYAEGSYDISANSTLTLGLRYTEDDFELNDLRATIYDTSGTPQFNSIPLSATPDETLVLPGFTGNSEEVTGRVIFDHKYSNEIMFFTSYSRGYRAGTYNGAAYLDLTQATFVEPETVDNYEAGIKSRFFDETFQLNATFYYADYQDQQIQEVIGATTFLRNASGNLTGGEIEIQWQVMDDLFISAGLGLSNTEYDDNQYFVANLNAGADCSQGPSGLGAEVFAAQCIDIAGNEFPFAPDVTANIYIEWFAAQFSDAELKVSVTGRYQGDTWFDSFNDDKTRQATSSSMQQKAYSLWDARIAYKAENYSVALYCKNLSDESYNSYGLDTAGTFGGDFLIRGVPRTYGIDISVDFE